MMYHTGFYGLLQWELRQMSRAWKWWRWVAMVCGFALAGVGIFFLLEWTSTRWTIPSVVENYLRLPFLSLLLNSAFWVDTVHPFLWGRGISWLWASAVICASLSLHLYVPIKGAYSITTERERGTLEQLLITQLKPIDIVLSKCIACSIFPFMFGLLMLCIGVLGDVAYSGSARSLGTLPLVLVQHFPDVLLLASFAVLVSAFSKRSYVALPVALIGGNIGLGALLWGAIILAHRSLPLHPFWSDWCIMLAVEFMLIIAFIKIAEWAVRKHPFQ